MKNTDLADTQLLLYKIYAHNDEMMMLFMKLI